MADSQSNPTSADTAHVDDPSTQRRADSARLDRRNARIGAASLVAIAIGSFAAGMVAVGALAVGAVAIGALSIGKARIRKLRIEELSVGRLRVEELIVEQGTAEGIEAIREGLLQAQAGKGRPADEFFSELEAEQGL